MAISDFDVKLDVARQQFQSMGSELFKGGGVPGTWNLLAMQRNQNAGAMFSMLDAGQVKLMEKWTGNKTYDAFRLYRKDITIDRWQASLEVSRVDLIEDQSGTVEARIRSFLGTQASWVDVKMYENLFANDTGIDGVSIFSTAHPFGNAGATWSNKTTDALSYNAYNSAKIAMRTLKGEKGVLMGIRPTHLFVGPALERTALEITGATRPVAISNTGGYDASSNVVAAVNTANVYEGEVTVVVCEHFANGTNDNDWFLFDASKDVKPMVVVQRRAPQLFEQTDMTSERRFNRDMFAFSVEADYGFGGGYPMVVYGKMS